MTTDYSEFTAMGSDWDDIAAEAIGQERILVNCAGTGNAIKTASRSKEDGSIKHFPLSAFEFVIQVNLIGTFRCIAKSAAGMLTLDPLSEDGDRGAIVNTASTSSIRGRARLADLAQDAVGVRRVVRVRAADGAAWQSLGSRVSSVDAPHAEVAAGHLGTIKLESSSFEATLSLILRGLDASPRSRA